MKQGASSVEKAVIRTAENWGRIIALLAARDGDIAGAEDALAGAVERALRTWPATGVPANPGGWVYRAALNVRRDVWSSAAFRSSVTLENLTHEPVAEVVEGLSFLELPDERLQLLAACAHPQVDPAVRPLLMLSAVMGLPARRIAEGMALPTATVSARLTRAKKRIRGAGLSMPVPERSELMDRLPSIHEAVYGVFAIEWKHAGSDLRTGLLGESRYLADLVAALCPDDAESHGLAGLICLCSARFPARRSGDELVTLAEQDPSAWDIGLVRAGEAHLREVRRCGGVGRFGIEAVIQALHMQGVRTGHTDWRALLCQHDHLLRIAPSLGAQVSRAAILQHIKGPEAALEELEQLLLSAPVFQPAWVVTANLHHALGRPKHAAQAMERALSLTTVVSERRYLEHTIRQWREADSSTHDPAQRPDGSTR